MFSIDVGLVDGIILGMSDGTSDSSAEESILVGLRLADGFELTEGYIDGNDEGYSDGNSDGIAEGALVGT